MIGDDSTTRQLCAIIEAGTSSPLPSLLSSSSSLSLIVLCGRLVNKVCAYLHAHTCKKLVVSCCSVSLSRTIIAIHLSIKQKLLLLLLLCRILVKKMQGKRSACLWVSCLVLSRLFYYYLNRRRALPQTLLLLLLQTCERGRVCRVVRRGGEGGGTNSIVSSSSSKE